MSVNKIAVFIDGQICRKHGTSRASRLIRAGCTFSVHHGNVTPFAGCNYDIIRIIPDSAQSFFRCDTRADLPILLISGRDDPCTGGEKGRKASFDCLAQAGFTNIHVQTLDHMRHEILNETDRELAYRMILSFLDPRT